MAQSRLASMVFFWRPAEGQLSNLWSDEARFHSGGLMAEARWTMTGAMPLGCVGESVYIPAVIWILRMEYNLCTQQGQHSSIPHVVEEWQSVSIKGTRHMQQGMIWTGIYTFGVVNPLHKLYDIWEWNTPFVNSRWNSILNQILVAADKYKQHILELATQLGGLPLLSSTQSLNKVGDASAFSVCQCH